MKSMRNCLILLLLCLFLICMAGCGNGENQVRTADDSIRLSNILFEGMVMNEEQKKALQTAKDINAGAAYNQNLCVFSAVNTSDQPINIEFLLVFYDKNGNIINSSGRHLDEWLPDSAIRFVIESNMKADRVELASQIVCGDTYVRTSFSEVNEAREVQNLTVSFAQELPASIQIEDAIYTLSDFSFYPSGSYSNGELNYTCEFKLKKVSGPDDSALHFDYRFVGEDGIIYEDETCRGGYMEDGETLLYHCNNIRLPAGHYTMEVFGDSVRSAA